MDLSSTESQESGGYQTFDFPESISSSSIEDARSSYSDFLSAITTERMSQRTKATGFMLLFLCFSGLATVLIVPSYGVSEKIGSAFSPLLRSCGSQKIDFPEEETAPLAYAVSGNSKTLAIGVPREEGGTVYLTSFKGSKDSFKALYKSKKGKLAAQEALLSDPVAGFGKSVSLGEKHLLVGAPDSNRVFVFTKTKHEHEYEESQELVGHSGSDFGFSVDIDESTSPHRIIVGAPATAEGQGAAYIYTMDKEVGHFLHSATLTAKGEYNDRGFGKAVAIEGHVAVVGSELDYPAGAGSLQQGFPSFSFQATDTVGAALIFSLGAGGEWHQDVVHRGGDQYRATGHRGAAAVAVGGGVVAVGCPEDALAGQAAGGDQALAAVGAVYLYRFSRQYAAWLQVGTLAPDCVREEAANDVDPGCPACAQRVCAASAFWGRGFGRAVAVHPGSRTVAAGAHDLGTGRGAVFAFDFEYAAAGEAMVDPKAFDLGGWAQSARLEGDAAEGGGDGSGGDGDDHFGAVVAVAGHNVVAGAWGAGGGGGAAHTFCIQETAWEQSCPDNRGLGLGLGEGGCDWWKEGP